jgi:hypothetical protein
MTEAHRPQPEPVLHRQHPRQDQLTGIAADDGRSKHGAAASRNDLHEPVAGALGAGAVALAIVAAQANHILAFAARSGLR